MIKSPIPFIQFCLEQEPSLCSLYPQYMHYLPISHLVAILNRPCLVVWPVYPQGSVLSKVSGICWGFYNVPLIFSLILSHLQTGNFVYVSYSSSSMSNCHLLFSIFTVLCSYLCYCAQGEHLFTPPAPQNKHSSKTRQSFLQRQQPAEGLTQRVLVYGSQPIFISHKHLHLGLSFKLLYDVCHSNTTQLMPVKQMNALTIIPESSICALLSMAHHHRWRLGRHKDSFHSKNLSLVQICLSNCLEFCHQNLIYLG